MWLREETNGVPYGRETCELAERLLAPQEGRCSMELAS
jgi:hypothetical protein